MRVVGYVLTAFALTLASWSMSGSGVRAAETVGPFKGTTLDGQPFDLGEYLGAVPVLIELGSIYCSSSVRSIPHLVSLQNRYGVEKLRVVGVNLDTYGVARVRRFFGQYRAELNFPVVVDVDLKISRALGVNTLPTYVLVDRSGRVAASFAGYHEQTERRLDEAVREVVEESAPTEPAAPVGEAVVILTPDNFTKTFQSTISVVGLTGGRPGPFTLRLNGGSEEQAKNHGKTFWVRTPLSLGSNYIEIRYPEGGGEARQALVLFREPLMGEGFEVSFPQFKFHTRERESRCTPCHEMDAEGAEGVGPMTTLCLTCHDNLTDQAWVHGPIPVGGCSPCHDFTSKPHKYQLTTRDAELCFTCHDNIRGRFARQHQHGPVALGMCTVCHSPHGSPFKYQVRLPQGDMCMSCHEDMKAEASRFVQHRPFREGRCSGCHDPHASDDSSHFLLGKGEGLCRLCHDDETMAGHKHPVGGPPKVAVKGMELDARGNLTCLTCHDPHASDSDRMSPVAGGCAGCHDM